MGSVPDAFQPRGTPPDLARASSRLSIGKCQHYESQYERRSLTDWRSAARPSVVEGQTIAGAVATAPIPDAEWLRLRSPPSLGSASPGFPWPGFPWLPSPEREPPDSQTEGEDWYETFPSNAPLAMGMSGRRPNATSRRSLAAQAPACGEWLSSSILPAHGSSSEPPLGHD